MINHPPTSLHKKKMSFILGRGKKGTPRRSPRATKGKRGPLFHEEFPGYNVFSKQLPDPGQQEDLAGLMTSSEESPSEGSYDSTYLTEVTPESESIPACEECRQEECVCGSSMSDSDFLSGGHGSCSVCGKDDCVCSSDDDGSLLSGGECSGCGEDEDECQCSEY
jgi:hypothetical protein